MRSAELLNVSRPHLVKLLETGEIAQLPKAGRHRRVARAKVLGYQREIDSRDLAQTLLELAERHGCDAIVMTAQSFQASDATGSVGCRIRTSRAATPRRR